MRSVESDRSRSTWRAVAVPAEHGGWGLTLEPVLLGMIVAPSGAGVALGCAALVAFVCRTPFKVAAVDRRRGRQLHRTVVAERFAAIELLTLAALLVVALQIASGPFWMPGWSRYRSLPASSGSTCDLVDDA